MAENQRVESSPIAGKLYKISFKKHADTGLKLTGVNTGDVFKINFHTSATGKYAFYISIRYQEKCMVRNAWDEGWGIEERGLPGPFPFVKDGPFMIEISLTKDRDSFEFKANGIHQFYYKHRLPVDDIDKLELSGGANYQQLLIV